jgi:RimJ/RimL family protein N-acetyltransferase
LKPECNAICNDPNGASSALLKKIGFSLENPHKKLFRDLKMRGLRDGGT